MKSLMLISSLFLATSLEAQVPATSTFTVPSNLPLEISFLHDGNGQYRLWCDGTIKKNFTTTETTKNPQQLGIFNVILKGTILERGKYSCQVSNFTSITHNGEQVEIEVKSNTFELEVFGPMKPGDITVTFTIKIGGL